MRTERRALARGPCSVDWRMARGPCSPQAKDVQRHMSTQRAWTAINRPIVVINLLHFKNATKSLWQNLLLASMRALWLVLASLASAQDAEEGCCSDDLTRDAVESNAVESCGTDQLTRGAAATTTTRATPTAQPGAWDIAPSVLIPVSYTHLTLPTILRV